jgi:CRP-like cAMP-binding protein
MDRTLWYLKQCKLFEDLTPSQAARLERCALMRTFKRRALVYAPTEPGQSVLVLARGRIKIKDVTPDGKETILAFIEEGEVFGELALLDGQPRSEYAEAVEESRVLMVPCEDVLWLMEQRPGLALAVTKLVGLRRRRIENRLRNVLFVPGRERLVRLLLELAEEHGRRAGDRCEIGLPLSHQELAGLIGLTRETVTVLLGRLQQEGLIEVSRRRLILLDGERLAAEAGSAPVGGPHRPEEFQPEHGKQRRPVR